MKRTIDVIVFGIYWCLEDDGSLCIKKYNGPSTMYTDGAYLYHGYRTNDKAEEANKALFTRDEDFDTWFIMYYKTPENTKSCADIESEMMALMRQCLRETADAINDYLDGDNVAEKLKEVSDADKGSMEVWNCLKCGKTFDCLNVSLVCLRSSLKKWKKHIAKYGGDK